MNAEPSATPPPPTSRSSLGSSSGPWQPPTVLELQAQLPKYEVSRLLGQGGMGAVYMGRQISLDRPVAIKILSAELDASAADFAERFKNEARAMAKLNHPGIVNVFESGETTKGLLYIVMEYINGTDVCQMINASGRLRTEHATAIAAHVCDALAYAHERGIIHRDIKPSNIMVGYDGSVKVADFGLAKINTQGHSAGLTQSGMAMGSMHFMAPEALIHGITVDHRADIYAVGVMLYQMLTGKVPRGLFELPSQQVPGLDPRYDAIIAQAMRESREQRYQSIGEMRQALDGILTHRIVKADAKHGNNAADPAALLPTQARPPRPAGRQPVGPPQPRVIVRTQRSSSLWIWIAVLVLGSAATWKYKGLPSLRNLSLVWPTDNATQAASTSFSPSSFASGRLPLGPVTDPLDTVWIRPDKSKHAFLANGQLIKTSPEGIASNRTWKCEPDGSVLVDLLPGKQWYHLDSRNAVMFVGYKKDAPTTDGEAFPIARITDLNDHDVVAPPSWMRANEKDLNPDAVDANSPSNTLWRLENEKGQRFYWLRFGPPGWLDLHQSGSAFFSLGSWDPGKDGVVTLHHPQFWPTQTATIKLNPKALTADFQLTKPGAEVVHCHVKKLTSNHPRVMPPETDWSPSGTVWEARGFTWIFYADGRYCEIPDKKSEVIRGKWSMRPDRTVRLDPELVPPLVATLNLSSCYVTRTTLKPGIVGNGYGAELARVVSLHGKLLTAWDHTPPGHQTRIIEDMAPKLSATSSPANAAEGWQPLFPSDSLAGWTGYTKPYQITGGVLICNGHGSLISPKDFKHFHLKFDVKLNNWADNGIGIWRRLDALNNLAPSTGFEVQIRDESQAPRQKEPKWMHHGGLYGIVAPSKYAMRPVGTWNAHEIIVKGTHIMVIVNGENVLDYDLSAPSPVDPKRPPFATADVGGRIGFFNNIAGSEFRNIQIKEIP